MKRTSQVLCLLAVLAAVACGGGPGDGNGGPGAGDSLPGDVAGEDSAVGDASPEDGTVPYDLWLVDGGGDAALEPLFLLAVEPATGRTTGGEQVVLKGRGFAAGLKVRFGEAWAPEVFVMTSEAASLTTPANFPGLVDVIAVLPDEQVAVKEDGFLYFNEVVIHEIDPPMGPTSGGMPLVVTGTGFTGDSHLLVGDREAIDVQVLDDSQILAITPPGTAGPVNVFVSNSK
ncbi:MAG: IPT/TIG domain-containing protein, partial [Deltaproteobacteria bacterium]|nr:IPT/TIG domain-containing protein [Deltaproteobacteria bacterium]